MTTLTTPPPSWEAHATQLLRQRNERESAPFLAVFGAFRHEERQHRRLADKHVEVRNQLAVVQHLLQAVKTRRAGSERVGAGGNEGVGGGDGSLTHSNNLGDSQSQSHSLAHSHGGELSPELEEIRSLLATLQDDLSARTTKDFDDVKIRIELERTIKQQKQLISDTAAEVVLLKSELSERTENLANTTNELVLSRNIVDTVQKELESSRNLLAATEGRLKEVENNNGRIMTKLMDEKQKSADLMNELTNLQHSKNSRATSIIGGGFSFMKKNIFGASQDDDDLEQQKEDEEFIDVGKDDIKEEDSRESLFSEVVVPRSVIKTIKCHGCEINDVSFGSRNTFITGGSDSVVKVFDLGRSTGRLSNAEDPRHAVVQDASHEFSCGGPVISVHSAGEHVAGACGDGIARIWNTRTGKLRQSLSGHANKVTSVRLVGTGEEKAVTGSADRIVRFWDLSRRQASLVCNLKTNSYIGAVDASSDCNTVCSGHQDGGLRLWNIMTKDRIHFIPKVHTAIVTCVQFDPRHGKYLLSASRDNTISVIDTRTYESILVLRAPGFSISSDWSQVSFSPDGSMIAAGSSDGRIFLWDTLSGELKNSIPCGNSVGITSVCWKDSGFLSGDKEGNVVLWG